MVVNKIFPTCKTTSKPMEKAEKASFHKNPCRDQKKNDTKKKDKGNCKGCNKIPSKDLE